MENGMNQIFRYCACECFTCGKHTQIRFPADELPEAGRPFVSYCKTCRAETPHTCVITRRMLIEQRNRLREEALRREIEDACAERGFACRFLYQSVIVTTPVADWAFDYHLPKKTLYHESTVKINFETGDYAKSHVQFRDRKMTALEVIAYIASHDAAKQKNLQTPAGETSEEK